MVYFMVFTLLKKLCPPGLLLGVSFYLNTHTALIDKYFADMIASYAYYVSGICIWISMGWILSVLVNVILWDEIFRRINIGID